MNVNRNLLSEGPLLPVAQQAANHPAFAAAAISPQSIQRWATVGLKQKSRVIKLEAVRVGKYLCTSAAAVERFFAAINAEPEPVAEPSAA